MKFMMMKDCKDEAAKYGGVRVCGMK